MTNNAPMASTHTKIARSVRLPTVKLAVDAATISVVMSDLPPSFPPPSLASPVSVVGSSSSPSSRRLWWALPLLTLSWLILVSVIVAGSVVVGWWETAPGSASAVASRLSFENDAADVKRYPSENSVFFVTAYGSQLTALESFVGFIDDDVAVETKKERFGEQSPTAQRRLGFQAMVGAKQIAEYVALKRLGYDVQLKFGAIVVEQSICQPKPAADSACKVLAPGDVIESVNGTDTPTVRELAPLLEKRTAGDVVTVVVHTLNANPNATRRTEKVRLIASPDQPNRTIIGIVPADTRTVEVPFEVGISTAAIGGPSAGLAFTLALLDELTPGNLMGRVRVATTGTISEDGTVGAIGALRQKAVAVRRAGAKVFLVPKSQSAAEIAAARQAAGSGVTVIPVGTVDDALVALKKFGGGTLPN